MHEGVVDVRAFNKVDAVFLRRLWKLCRLGNPAVVSRETMALCALLLVALASQLLIYQVGKIPSEFYPVLMLQDRAGFYELVGKAVALTTVEGLVLAVLSLLARILAIFWRKNITQHVQELYLSADRVFYQLAHRLDNPDQRITQDVSNFCSVLFLLAPDVVVAPFIVIYYTYMTWWITGWWGPLIVYGYFLIGFLVNRILMGWVAEFVFRQEKCEGDFRFEHVQVRAHTEAIALYRSYRDERCSSEALLSAALDNQRSLTYRQMCVDLMVNIHAYIGGYLSYVVVAIPLFMGMYKHLEGQSPGTEGSSDEQLASLISFSAFICLSLIGEFSRLMRLSTQLSRLAGYTGRVGELLEVMHTTPTLHPMRQIGDENADAQRPGEDEKRWGKGLETDDDIVLALQDVSWGTPQGQLLGAGVSLQLRSGDNLLVIGPSGSGKSSLFRVLAGLWPVMCGVVKVPAAATASLFFLPQTPYLPLGSLYTQITYPRLASPQRAPRSRISSPICLSWTSVWRGTSGIVADTLLPGSVRLEEGLLEQRQAGDELETDSEDMLRAEELLRLLGLSHLIERYGWHRPIVHWDDILSNGEKQRICLARMLFHDPAVAFMDEATSQMEEEMERSVYQLCKDRGIVCISIGHRASLLQYHNVVLRKVPDDTTAWNLVRLSHDSMLPPCCDREQCM